MEIAQTRQKSIDELTANVKAMEANRTITKPRESDGMIMEKLSKDLAALQEKYDKKVEELARKEGHVMQLQTIIDDWDEWYEGYLKTEAQNEDDADWLKEDGKKTIYPRRSLRLKPRSLWSRT